MHLRPQESRRSVAQMDALEVSRSGLEARFEKVMPQPGNNVRITFFYGADAVSSCHSTEQDGLWAT